MIRLRTNAAINAKSSLCAAGSILLVGALMATGLPLPSAPQSPQPVGPQRPLSPQAEQKTFRLDPGLRIELVACEPQIQSPVALAFDELGRLWVVEMQDYPNGPAPGEKPQGRLRILRDADGDGFYETSTVFAEHLLFANGVLPWKDGVIVTQAPNIVFLRDTDGNGRCDRSEVLYEGFAAENPQLRVSHPVLGIDGWIYVANGLRGGQVRRAGDAAAKPVSLSGMDFRFDPLRGRYEAISGMGQYGNTFDDWGNRFVCDNRHHLRHIVLPNRYLKRNPFLAVGKVVEDVSELEEGMAGSGAKIYPISKNWTTSNLHAGHFTAACGVHVYRSGLLPKAYYGIAFTCDPTGNLVHGEVLRPHGATFRSRPTRKGVEFLATADEWFRPVFLTDGPDGALYVVDMYRAVIEHPQFMPPELQKRPDLNLGKEKGRIWRIVPEKHRPGNTRPMLAKATTAELVRALSHEHAWWRTTAQRLLLQRQDRSATRWLRQVCDSGDDARGRLHAAWLLMALQDMDERTLQRLLQDSQPRIREHAVRMAEGWLSKSPTIRQRVLALAEDDDARVRFQVALSLGEWDDDRSVPALAKIALAGIDDEFARSAVASSVPQRAGMLLAALLNGEEGLSARPTPQVQALLREIAALVGGRRDAREVTQVLAALTQLRGTAGPTWQFAALEGLADAMARRGTSFRGFLMKLPPSAKDTVAKTQSLLADAAALARNGTADQATRLSAIRLLAHAPWEDARPALLSLVGPEHATEVRQTAVRALAAHTDPEVGKVLLQTWPRSTPAMRSAITDALLRQPDRIRLLLAEVQAGRVKSGDIDALSTRRLLSHGSADIRAAAQKLLQSNLPAERQKVLARYREALTRKGDPKRGLEVFRKHCATCHRIGDVGTDVGPVISDTRVKTADALLNDILNPNQAIDNNYLNYVISTKDGKVYSGIIAAETASSITVKRANAESDTVLRQDIEEIASSGVSLMPEGLEKSISIAEMADLLSFLKNWRYLDGSVPPDIVGK